MSVGCLSKRGGSTVAGPLNEDAFLEVLLDVEAESYEFVEGDNGTLAEVCTAVEALEAITTILKGQNYHVLEAELFLASHEYYCD